MKRASKGKFEDEEADTKDEKVICCRIAVAFGLQPIEAKASTQDKINTDAGDSTPQWELVPMKPGRVCIYFPADKETSNLRVHLHAPFASTVARDSVRDCAGNNTLRDHLAELLAESMHEIREQGLLNVRALALLPNDKDNLPEFYQPLMDRLVEEFNDRELVPMKYGGHAPAFGIFRGAKALSDLIDDDDMVKLLGDDYFPPIWAANPPQRNQREDNFLSMLTIEEWTEKDLVSALSEMDVESRTKWMSTKADEWHQRLYIELEDHAYDLEDVAFIRTSDGKYFKGSNCYFPTEEVEKDDRFPRVAKGVFLSGKNKDQQKKARDFLAEVGVREVDEGVEIEGLLRVYYSYNSQRPKRKDHYSHLRRFMRFLKNHPEQHDLFQEAYLLMVDVEEDLEWTVPPKIYLDDPFMNTGLRAYYDGMAAKDEIHPLSAVYEKSGIKPEELGEFAKRLNVIANLRIEETKVSYHHPEWTNMSRGGGERWTIGTNKDYHIPHLVEFLASPSITKSRLVWRTMKESCEGYWCPYLWAKEINPTLPPLNRPLSMTEQPVGFLQQAGPTPLCQLPDGFGTDGRA
jgi:hypothetical protein